MRHLARTNSLYPFPYSLIQTPIWGKIYAWHWQRFFFSLKSFGVKYCRSYLIALLCCWLVFFKTKSGIFKACICVTFCKWKVMILSKYELGHVIIGSCCCFFNILCNTWFYTSFLTQKIHYANAYIGRWSKCLHVHSNWMEFGNLSRVLLLVKDKIR